VTRQHLGQEVEDYAHGLKIEALGRLAALSLDTRAAIARRVSP
jgi:hypothetical protein